MLGMLENIHRIFYFQGKGSQGKAEEKQKEI